MRRHPFNAIGSNAIVAIANAAAEGLDIRRSQRGVDQQEIIAASRSFDEGNGANGGLHSRSTRPSETALLNTVDVFNCRNNSRCSPAQPSTSNCSRMWLVVSPVSTFCIRR